jgi:hypothetical protein
LRTPIAIANCIGAARFGLRGRKRCRKRCTGRITLLERFAGARYMRSFKPARINHALTG